MLDLLHLETTFSNILSTYYPYDIKASPILQQWYDNKKHFIDFLGGNTYTYQYFNEHIENKDQAVFDLIKMFENNGLFDATEDTQSLFTFLRDIDPESLLKNRLSEHKVFFNEKCPKGMKITKIIKKIAPSKANQFRNFYSFFLYQKNVKGKMYISVNPIDFLTMAINKNNWKTCHHLSDVYKGGPLSFLTDSVTLIAYLSNRNVNYQETEWNDKQWKVLFHVDLKNKNVIIKEPYPFVDANITKFLMNYIIDFFELSSYKIIGGEDTLQYYTDVDNAVHCTIRNYINNMRGIISNSEAPPMVVGNNPLCLSCGEKVITRPNTFECTDCNPVEYCCTCAEKHSLSDLIVVEDEHYCEDCFDDNFILHEETGEHVRIACI